MPHMGEMSQGAGGIPVAVTPTASPYDYAANTLGTLYASGGTVTAVQLTRGAVSVPVALLGGSFAMRAGDVIRITYAVAPTLLWVPL